MKIFPLYTCKINFIGVHFRLFLFQRVGRRGDGATGRKRRGEGYSPIRGGEGYSPIREGGFFAKTAKDFRSNFPQN